MADYFVIDRFEGDFAVLEDGDCVLHDVKRVFLPPDAAAGDAVVPLPDGRYAVDARRTTERRERIRKKINGLFEQKP